MNTVDRNIKFKEKRLLFLECVVLIEEDRSLSINIHQKPRHESLRFDSHQWNTNLT